MSLRIEALARRVQNDPFFLASALASYARSEGLTHATMAARLGCDRGELSRIGLCRRPRPEPAQFQEDIARVAAAFAISGDVLAEAVRRAETLAALRTSPPHDAGMLMAARDREDDDDAGDDDETSP
jgi:hypothetical protein